MKSIAALFLGVFLLAGAVLPHTDVRELGKIPGLIGHYQEHRRESGGNLGFLAFLRLHYGQGSAHAKSHCGDHCLPAFHVHCAGMSFIIPTATIFLSRRVCILASRRACVYRNAYVYLFSDSLLRPPRV